MDDELSQLTMNKQQSAADPFEGKTLAEVLREKREATDKILQNTKVN